MEREKFEESWRQAFNQAEMSPSDKVWTNIELDLEKADGDKLKRRLLYYQMLAAASVVFAMAIGGIGYYYSFKTDRGASTLAVSEQTSPETSNESAGRIDTFRAQEEMVLHQDETVAHDNTASANQEGTEKTGTPPVDTDTPTSRRVESANPPAPAIARVESSDAHQRSVASLAPVEDSGATTPERHPAAALPLQLDERELPPLYASREVKLNFEKKEPEVDPVLAMLAKLEQREREVQDERDRKKNDEWDQESLWTSIGFSAGSFNVAQVPSASPSASSGSLAAMALAAPIVDQEAKASGYSYSMGVNVGTRIAERWVLQGGVNYLTQSSEYTSSTLVVDGPGFMSAERYRPATTNALVNADEFELGNRIVYSAPYSVNNSMRYLSIPVQAGYQLIDKTFGWQLNAGVATDLFLQNTVKGESDQLARTTAPGGSDSPYRTVNLSGLLGTEFSYRFGPHYRISLNPGIRYPFNTIYKSELGVDSSPLTFDVGLRFRYIFR